MKRLLESAVLIGLCAFASFAQSAKPSDCDELKTRATGMENRLKDWPALARYHNANAALPAAGSQENRVVFMGDSITDNWSKPGFGGFFPGRPYVNRGISGQTTPQMLIRFRPDAIALHPKVIVILAGTNDIAGNTGPMTLAAIEDNLSSMADLAAANGIRVVLASLLPVSDYEKTKEGKPINQTTRRPPEQIRALNEWIRSFAERNKLTYLDYYSAMIDAQGFFKAELSNDGLHPNDKGYAVMAPLAEQAIAAALKKKK
jgi:lysophospholipase L1-like esterase